MSGCRPSRRGRDLGSVTCGWLDARPTQSPRIVLRSHGHTRATVGAALESLHRNRHGTRPATLGCNPNGCCKVTAPLAAAVLVPTINCTKAGLSAGPDVRAFPALISGSNKHLRNWIMVINRTNDFIECRRRAFRETTLIVECYAAAISTVQLSPFSHIEYSPISDVPPYTSRSFQCPA